VGLHRLDRDELCSILSLYHLDGLEDWAELPSGTEHLVYTIQVSGRRYLLRFSAHRRFADMVFEKELLSHLRRLGLPVPRVVENVASGSFTPWSARGRYVSLFEDTGGRRLGLFELRTRHARAIGDFLGRMHRAGETFAEDRAIPPVTEALAAAWTRVERGLSRPKVRAVVGESVAVFERELRDQERRRFSPPRTLVHGDLFVGSARFEGDQLVGVLDFANAGIGRATWDLAMAVNAWCWEPSVRQKGGPAGAFGLAKVRGLLSAYEAVRPLSAFEARELALDLRLAPLFYGLVRVAEHEVGRSRRPYRDHRHFVARLDALAGDGATTLVERAMVASEKV